MLHTSVLGKQAEIEPNHSVMTTGLHLILCPGSERPGVLLLGPYTGQSGLVLRLTAVLISWQIGGGRNFNHHVLHVAMDAIKESREMRLQPFNEYRKRFGLKPYTSFQELTGRRRPLLPGHSLYP